MTPEWVLIVSLLGWLVLVASAYRARRVSASKTVFYALVWGAIFFAMAAFFTAVG